MEHLVILRSDLLRAIVTGRKTIEGRVSQRRTAPFGQVRAEDLLWLKPVSGPITARATVGRVWSFERSVTCDWMSMVGRFRGALADGGWLRQRAGCARYATFMRLRGVAMVPSVWIDKRDRRAWVVLDGPLDDTFGTRVSS